MDLHEVDSKILNYHALLQLKRRDEEFNQKPCGSIIFYFKTYAQKST